MSSKRVSGVGPAESNATSNTKGTNNTKDNVNAKGANGKANGANGNDVKGKTTPVPDTLPKLIGATLAMLVIGMLLLGGVDLIYSLIKGIPVGQISGWVVAMPTIFVFAEELKRHKDLTARWLITLLGIVIGLSLGLVLTIFLPTWWVALATGAVGATVGALTYALVWWAGTTAFSR